LINRELIEVFSEIAREKNVERSELGSILEQLFMYIIEKERGDNTNCSVIVNIDKGEIEIYAEKEIVDDVEDPVLEILLEDANKAMPGESFEVGDVFVEVIDPTIFGRRMINTAKQFFSQRLQDVEKHYIYEDYSQRIGEIVIGIVHQVQRDNVFINIEQAELRLPKKEQIQSERYRRGDTIRTVVKSVEVNPRGPEIIVSRSDNHFLYKMFEMEVPEIDDGIIEILAIARHPGERSKIIVKSQDRRIDPVGACVGMRGSRIQAIVRELNNEKIDIINHSEQPEILISRALSPAKPIDLYIDDERKYCVTLFNDDELEFAIGRGGVNINLASRVTGFRIDAFGKKQYERQQEDQATALADVPDFPKDLVKTLAENNIETVSNLLNADEENLLAIDAVNDKNLEQCYLVVQSFIERVEEEEKEEKIELEKILEEVAATDESATEDNASEEIEEIQKVEPQDTNKAAEVTEEGVDEAEEPVKEDEATVDENVQNEQLEEEVAAEKEEVEEA
jgi:N utilization substance protein A|tara:strand:+ start:15578 stop:17104 length:1527 start_codon:yes stop_codon:yes gene_type:complete